MDSQTAVHSLRAAVLRIVAAFSVALAFSFGVYLLLEATRGSAGLISFTFLLLLPAAVSAFVAYVADPYGERSMGSYLKVPGWLLLAVIAVSIFALQEGVICILMLSPLWLVSGMVGAGATYKARHLLKSGKTYCAALLALPLVAVQVEPQFSWPSEMRTVERSIVIEASADRIWPLLRGIPVVRRGEGQWNLSQDLVGLPRPLGATLKGEGRGAERLAEWQRGISFQEKIIEWEVNRRIGWRFIFNDLDGWEFTDRHLTPESAYFRVVSGGYSMMPLGPNRTKLVLDTRYWMRTPVNAYSALWGELFVGDLENNLLAVVKQRAENPEETAPTS